MTFGSGHDREKLEQSLVGTSPISPWMMQKLRLSFVQQEQRKVTVVFLGETLDRAEFRKVLRETAWPGQIYGDPDTGCGVGTRVDSPQASFLETQAIPLTRITMQNSSKGRGR